MVTVCLFSLASCDAIKHKYEDLTMSVYEVEKFNWGVTQSDTGEVLKFDLNTSNDIITNKMFDAQGNEVERWLSNGQWGRGSHGMGGDITEKRIPKYFQIAYYDYVEDTFYQLRGELPQQRLYELFKQKTVDVRSSGISRGRVIQRFNQIQIGVAPKGYVIVWVGSDGHSDQVEIGQYQAQINSNLTPSEYNKKYGQGVSFELVDRWPLLKEWNMGKWDQKGEALVAKLKTGWLPTPEYYQMARVKYPYRIEMTGNAQLVEYQGRYANKEREFVLNRDLAKAQTQLKGAPEDLWLFFNDKQGQRHSVRIDFYQKGRIKAEPDMNGFIGEPDISTVWDAFHKLMPNRTIADNDKPVNDTDMATLEIHMSEDMGEVLAYLVKGNQRIELPLYKAELEDLKPYSYYQDEESPPAEVIERIKNGVLSYSLRMTCCVGDPCPQTGMWYCEGVSPEQGIYMRKGDPMPGQSYNKEARTKMQWHLIKPMDNS
jgi:hypothetical protein